MLLAWETRLDSDFCQICSCYFQAFWLFDKYSCLISFATPVFTLFHGQIWIPLQFLDTACLEDSKKTLHAYFDELLAAIFAIKPTFNKREMLKSCDKLRLMKINDNNHWFIRIKNQLSSIIISHHQWSSIGIKCHRHQ